MSALSSHIYNLSKRILRSGVIYGVHILVLSYFVLYVQYLVSFPGPALLSIACSLRTGRTWERGYAILQACEIAKRDIQ